MPMWLSFLTTIAASAIGTAIAGVLGVRYGLAKLRKEKAFEKRLSWYETTVTDLSSAAETLTRAAAASRARGPADDSSSLWAEALPVLNRVERLKIEALMYASRSAFEAMFEASDDIGVLLRTAGLTDVPTLKGELHPQARLLEICSKLIRHAVQRLADDVREHLQLEVLPANPDTGIYDRDYREHIADLAARGLWPPPKPLAPEPETTESSPS